MKLSTIVKLLEHLIEPILFETFNLIIIDENNLKKEFDSVNICILHNIGVGGFLNMIAIIS